MSSRIDRYLNQEANAETQYLEYGFMAFMALLLIKFVTESAAAKRNRQATTNKMKLEATKMSLMAKMSMAASAARGRGGGGGGGGGGGSNK